MLTNVQKKEIVLAINREITRLGSANQVANKCGVSGGTISQMRNTNWELIREELWQRVAAKLNVSFSEWQIADDTTNFKILFQVFEDAKKGKLFIPVSEKAGSSKTVAAKMYAEINAGQYVYYLQCQEWGRRDFIEALAESLGIEIPRGANAHLKLANSVIDFFNERSHEDPELILDELDKLKPAALRYIIPFYNKLEDKIGLTALGTENLSKEIKKGVKLNIKGYDEIDSRFGRNFIRLVGATKQDVSKICNANGISDKQLHSRIFNECQPIQKTLSDGKNKQFIEVVEDMRRVKRIIKRELKKTNTYES